MKTYIYAAVAGILALSSCSQEAPSAAGLSGDGHRIYFRSYLPTVTQTRAGVISQENLSECRVTAIRIDTPTGSATGEITPYFDDIRFVKDSAGRFIAQD